jgi:predicted dehydrogenase
VGVTSTLRVGVIGLGFIGPAHVDALRRIPGVHVVAAAGSGPHVFDAASALGIDRAYTDYRELLQDPSIDVVHNCTPNYLHFVVNRASVEAGKACFAEKPLTLTSTQAAELLGLANDCNARVAVNFNHRGFPQVQQARAIIEAGQIGKVYAVHGSYLQDWLLLDTDWNWRVDPQMGGPSRAVADIGSHWMDLAQHVIGSQIVEVMADLYTAIPLRRRSIATQPTFAEGLAENSRGTPFEVTSEDYASVLIRFENGAHGTFTVSQISAGRKNRLMLEIDGECGALAWNSENSERLWIGSREDSARVDQRGATRALVPGTSTLPPGHSEGWNDALRTTIVGFYTSLAAISQRPPWVASWEDGWRAVALTEAILTSHRNRRWTAVHPMPLA